MNTKPKKVQTNPFSFQNWWDREGHNCRAAWNAAETRSKKK